MNRIVSRRHLIAGTIAARLLGQQTARPQKIVVTGGHPGDPECGCAGTVARFTDQGCEAVLLYLNRGEGYCGNASLDRCVAIRTAEAQAASKILNARAVFADQYDGRASVDNVHFESFARLLSAEKPDVVFTHWPVDSHRDHRAVSSLTLDAWLKGGKKFALYYYEVAEDTLMFSPSEYVDISGVESRRRAACFAHASQNPNKWYPKQVEITRARGAGIGCAQAEGFLRQAGSPKALLPSPG